MRPAIDVLGVDNDRLVIASDNDCKFSLLSLLLTLVRRTHFSSTLRENAKFV